jgi:energy-converting hydrogenase B subunit D
VTTVQAVTIVAVAITGGCVALVTNPLRETLLLSIYGLALAALFFSLQAPDVALSEIVVGSVGLPIVILAALRRVHEDSRAREKERRRK